MKKIFINLVILLTVLIIGMEVLIESKSVLESGKLLL